MSQVDAASGTKTRTEPIQADAQGSGIQNADRGALRDAAATKSAEATDRVAAKADSDSFSARAPRPATQSVPLPRQKPEAPKPPLPQEKPALKDGDFLNDPTKMTAAQARHLERLSNDPSIPASTRRDMKAFLDDYKKGKDSLFPEGNADFTPEQWQRFHDAKKRMPQTKTF